MTGAGGRSAAVGAVLIALLATACSAPDSAIPDGYTRTDSAGVTITESTEPRWGEGEGWRIAPEPELVIGEVEGDERHLVDVGGPGDGPAEFRFP